MYQQVQISSIKKYYSLLCNVFPEDFERDIIMFFLLWMDVLGKKALENFTLFPEDRSTPSPIYDIIHILSKPYEVGESNVSRSLWAHPRDRQICVY